MRGVLELNEHLADVLPLEQANERPGRMLDAINDGLLPLEPASRNPGTHIGIELGLPVEMVRDDKALERQTLAHGEAYIARAGRGRRLIVVK